MKKIISEINKLGRLHISLIEPENITTIVSKIHSKSKPLDLENNYLIDNLTAAKGLYVFFAKFPFRKYEHLLGFGRKWGVLRDKDAPPNCPRFHKGNANFKKNKKLLFENQYVPFYLGKSEKIQERVLCHIETELDKTVYALKLKARNNILKNIVFKLGYVEFYIDDGSYFCIELLEKEVRNFLRPIIGKQ
ncbi:MAG: hypothetical protein ABFS18_13835 [Thermodesulfobacteriota bacterium]